MALDAETDKKRIEIEEFFKTAFVADSAKVLHLTRQQRKEFKILSVVELKDEKRGTFYIASVYPKN